MNAFPMYVGMNRTATAKTAKPIRVPHVRGDEPNKPLKEMKQ